MNAGRLITLKMLEDADACSSQIEEFKDRFGDSVKVTKALCESVAQVFDWEFAAEHFLSASLLDDYVYMKRKYGRQTAPLWEEYERQSTALMAEYTRQERPLWAEYDRQSAPLWEEYKRQTSALLAEYVRQKALLWEEYERQKAPFLAEYNRQKAILFWKLYNSEA